MTPTPNARAVVEWIDRMLDGADVPRMTPDQRAVMLRAFTKSEPRRRPMGASKTPAPRERALAMLEDLATAALPGDRLTPPPWGAVDTRRADGSEESYLDAAAQLQPADPYDDLDGLPLVERINARLATQGIRPLPKDHR